MPDSVVPARYRSAERLTFFTDAVVAIAMTLLILPLLESVSEAASEGLGTAAWVEDHGGQLFSFVLSFVIIASFWVNHERLFDAVERRNPLLMVLNIAWMVTIVFLPVATALVGSMDADDLQYVLYIGTMLASSLLMWAMFTLVARTPALWEDPDTVPSHGGWLERAMTSALFAVALVLALLVPGVGYYSLFVLVLTGPLIRLVHRLEGKPAR